MGACQKNARGEWKGLQLENLKQFNQENIC